MTLRRFIRTTKYCVEIQEMNAHKLDYYMKPNIFHFYHQRSTSIFESNAFNIINTKDILVHRIHFGFGNIIIVNQQLGQLKWEFQN